LRMALPGVPDGPTTVPSSTPIRLAVPIAVTGESGKRVASLRSIRVSARLPTSLSFRGRGQDNGHYDAEYRAHRAGRSLLPVPRRPGRRPHHSRRTGHGSRPAVQGGPADVPPHPGEGRGPPDVAATADPDRGLHRHPLLVDRRAGHSRLCPGLRDPLRHREASP
jgi:hypothetical protein